MKLKNYEIKAYVTKDLHERVRLEALARNTKMAMIIRDSLTQYFSLQEELASVIETPGNLGESHNGRIIHTLLARTEERVQLIIKELEDKLEGAYTKLHMLIVMIDLFYLDLMQYFPEIPKDFTIEATALAKIRYEKWIRAIKTHVLKE